MKKLPPGEAASRHAERNRAKNQYRKDNKIKTVIVLTEKRKAEMREYAAKYRAARKKESTFKPKGDPARLEQMREYARTARALAKAKTAEERALHKKAKADRIERMKVELLEARLIKKQATKDERNRKRREVRAIEKASRPPKVKVVKVKVTPPRKLQTAKVKKMGKVVSEAKPMIISNNSTEGKVKLVISPKLTVYIRPDQDPDAVKAKYLNR